MSEKQNTPNTSIDEKTINAILDEGEMPHRNSLQSFYEPSFEYLALLIEAAEEKQSESDKHKTITEISGNVCTYYIETFYKKPFTHPDNAVNRWMVYCIYGEFPKMSEYYWHNLAEKMYLTNGTAKNISSIEELLETIAKHAAEIGYIGSLQKSISLLEAANLKITRIGSVEDSYTLEEASLAVQTTNSNLLIKILETLSKTKPEHEKPIANSYGESVSYLIDSSVSVKRYHDKRMVFLELSDVPGKYKPKILLTEINGGSEQSAIEKTCKTMKRRFGSYEGPTMTSDGLSLQQPAKSRYWETTIKHGEAEIPVFRYQYIVKKEKAGDAITVSARTSDGEYIKSWIVGVVDPEIEETAIKEAKAIIAAHWNLYAPFLIEYSNAIKAQYRKTGKTPTYNIQSHLLRLENT